MFGIEFGTIEWVTLGSTAVAGLTMLIKIIKAIRIGSNAVKTFANNQIDNAQRLLNSKIDEYQLKANENFNEYELRLQNLQQELRDEKASVIEYQNQIREMLNNA